MEYVLIRKGLFFFQKMFIRALGPIQRPMQLVLVVFFPRERRSGREVEHLCPSNAEVKNEWSYYYTLYAFMVRALNTVVVEKYNMMIGMA
jgi:hypothetical protein